MANANPSRRSFLFLAATIGVLALLLREQFILLAQPESPLSGDVRQYVAYALNLVQHGVFSSAMPGSAVIAPDAFRGPGYPLFLAACMKLSGVETEAWYYLATHAQAILGSATVVMGILLARYWLPASAALCAGLLMALWPHHIAATGALLSEVVLGFTLMLALLLTARAHRAQGVGMAAAAGAAFGFAYLINPIILLFPLVVAIVFWRSGQVRKAAGLLALVAAFAGGWAIRNSAIPPDPGPGRAAINLVQGSWPMFQSAWVERLNDPVAQKIMADTEAEQRLLSSDPARGLSAMAKRMEEAPAAYAHWYLVEKPYLLWDWDIRIGTGDVYFLQVQKSPLETNALLHGIKELFRALNPVFFVLALGSMVVILFRWTTGRPVDTALVLVAMFFAYVTAVHDIFQAEPRYAIPYRPFELLLAVGALSWLATKLIARLREPTAEASSAS